MKFTTTVADFREAFLRAMLTLDKRQGSEGSLLFLRASKDDKGIILFSTNGTMMSKVPFAGTVAEEGEVLFDPKLLLTPIAMLESTAEMQFSLRADGAKLMIRCWKFRPSFPIAHNTESMRKLVDGMPLGEEPAAVSIPLNSLREVVARTSGFAFKETDQSYQLQNLLLMAEGNKLDAYASDNVVLAHASVVDEGISGTINLNIPSIALPTVQRMLQKLKPGDEAKQIRIILSKDLTGTVSRFYVCSDDLVFGCAVSAYQMPVSATKAEAGLKAAASVELDRQGLSEVLQRCQPFCREGKWIDLQLDEDILTVRGSGSGTVQDGGEVEDEIEGNFGRGQDKQTLNVHSLINVLKTIQEDAISLRFTNRTPVMVVSGDEKSRASYILTVARVSAAAATTEAKPKAA